MRMAAQPAAAAELLCTAGCHFGASSVTLPLPLTLTLTLPLPLPRSSSFSTYYPHRSIVKAEWPYP